MIYRGTQRKQRTWTSYLIAAASSVKVGWKPFGSGRRRVDDLPSARGNATPRRRAIVRATLGKCLCIFLKPLSVATRENAEEAEDSHLERTQPAGHSHCPWASARHRKTRHAGQAGRPNSHAYCGCNRAPGTAAERARRRLKRSRDTRGKIPLRGWGRAVT
jgi:hypothetical protein